MSDQPPPELTVLLPAYEEAANLEWLLPALQAAVQALHVPFEILVADAEQPRDPTPEVCARYGVTCLARAGGALYSHAIRTGLAASRGRWVVIMDADGSHRPDFIANLWAERLHADLVIASRYIPGGRTENPAILVFLSLAVNVVFRLTLGLKCADVSNSFRLYRGEDVRRLDLECLNFDIVEEILVKLCAQRPDFSVKEIPFFFEKRREGKTKRDLIAFAFSYLATLKRLRRLKNEARKTSARS